MTAKKTTEVVVRPPFKVTHAGVGYWPGEQADVPPHVAAEWVKLGFAEPVDPVDEQADDEQPADQAEQPKASKPKRARRSSGHDS